MQNRREKAQKDIRRTGYQDVDIRISEYQVAGHQGNREFGDCPRTKLKKQNWCGICAHSELEKLWRESEAKTRQLEMLPVNYSTITIVSTVSYGEYKFFFLTPVRICR